MHKLNIEFICHKDIEEFHIADMLNYFLQNYGYVCAEEEANGVSLIEGYGDSNAYYILSKKVED